MSTTQCFLITMCICNIWLDHSSSFSQAKTPCYCLKGRSSLPLKLQSEMKHTLLCTKILIKNIHVILQGVLHAYMIVILTLISKMFASHIIPLYKLFNVYSVHIQSPTPLPGISNICISFVFFLLVPTRVIHHKHSIFSSPLNSELTSA